MKIHHLNQTFKCAGCRTTFPILEFKRIMNFTLCEAKFYCRNCRQTLGILPFARWNALHHEALEEKKRQENPRKSSR